MWLGVLLLQFLYLPVLFSQLDHTLDLLDLLVESNVLVGRGFLNDYENMENQKPAGGKQHEQSPYYEHEPKDDPKPLLETLNDKDDCDYAANRVAHNDQDENEEGLVVVSFNAVVQPQAVVIKVDYATLASLTVDCVVCAEGETSLAEFEELYLSVVLNGEASLFDVGEEGKSFERVIVLEVGSAQGLGEGLNLVVLWGSRGPSIQDQNEQDRQCE